MKEIPEIVQFLRGLQAFDSLQPAQLGAAAQAIEIAYYRQGEGILEIGSDNPHLHIIRSGAVELRNEDAEMMTRLAEGDCFGFPSLMNNAPARNHSIAPSIEATISSAGSSISIKKRTMPTDSAPDSEGGSYARAQAGSSVFSSC